MVTGIQSVTETKANKSPAPSTLNDKPTFGRRLIRVKVYNFPSKTPEVRVLSKASLQIAAKKMIASRRFGARPHKAIRTAAIDEMKTIQKGVVSASSIVYKEGISGSALAIKLVTNLSVKRPIRIKLSVTINVGMSMLRGASSRVMVLFPSLAGLGTLL